MANYSHASDVSKLKDIDLTMCTFVSAQRKIWVPDWESDSAQGTGKLENDEPMASDADSVLYKRQWLTADNAQQQLIGCHSATQHKAGGITSQKVRCHRLLCVRSRAIL